MTTLRRPGTAAIALVAAAGLAAGVGAAWLVATGERADRPAAEAVIALIVGWSYIASGLVAWRVRPANTLGPAMLGIGFASFAACLAHSDAALAFTVGTAVEGVYLAGFVYLVLAFPTGRLTRGLDRALVAAAVLLAVVVEVAWLLLADSSVWCDGCPENLLQLSRNDTAAETVLDLQRLAAVVLSLFTVGLLVERWRRASAAQRHAVAPVLWAGSATFAALALTVLNDALDEPLGPAPAWAAQLLFAALPVAVLTVLLREQLARGAVAGLVVELGEAGAGVDLRAALARALRDPSLEVAYWLPTESRYVDAAGAPVDPQEDGGRAVTVVEREGKPVAALLHDPALRERPELVDSVCAAAGLALENERLHAELRARLDDLQASRARIVQATADERRRLERDLHDGTQQRLVAIALTLGLAESRLTRDPAAAAPILAEARESLVQALAELRELSQGIHPSILAERGLAAGLEELARRGTLPVRLELELEQPLPPHVEATAFFVVSEALANAEKHAAAAGCLVSASQENGRLVVAVTDDGTGGADLGGGSGLRGLADRVEAIGGHLSVSSPPSGGTTVTVELPCG